MTGFIDKKLPKIKVPEAMPSARLWPLAICFRPHGGDWHLYGVAKGKNDGCVILGHYFAVNSMGVWALVDRESGMVVWSIPEGFKVQA